LVRWALSQPFDSDHQPENQRNDNRQQSRRGTEGDTMETVEHTIDEILTGGDRLFDAYEDSRVRRLLLIDGPAVLGIEEWTAMQQRLRIGLGEHALGHIADAGLIDRALVPMMAHLLFGAFSQGVLQIAAADDAKEASRLARAAYHQLAKGLLAGGWWLKRRSGGEVDVN
jgi:hypothetical protein